METQTTLSSACCSARRYINPVYVHHLPRLRTSNVDRSNERKWLYTKKKNTRTRYTAQTIMDDDYADNIVLSGKYTYPSRIPAAMSGASSSRHWLPRECRQNRVHGFNRKWDISTLNGGSLKLVAKSTYLGSSVSTTDIDINKRLAKAWTAKKGYRSYRTQ